MLCSIMSLTDAPSFCCLRMKYQYNIEVNQLYQQAQRNINYVYKTCLSIARVSALEGFQTFNAPHFWNNEHHLFASKV